MSEQIFHIGVKGLIRNKQGEFLLLNIDPSRLLKEKTSTWDIPGGRMEAGESFETTLAREIKEELDVSYDTKPDFFGTILTRLQIPTDRGKVALVLMLYLLTIPDNAKIKLSHEHVSYEWVDLETAIERLKDKYSESFARQMRKGVTDRHHKKLVRDNIPEIIRADNHEPIIRILSDDEYKTELVNKLSEELKEFSLDSSIEELADIAEVADALRESIGKSAEELEEARRIKNKRNGAFKNKIYLEGVK